MTTPPLKGQSPIFSSFLTTMSNYFQQIHFNSYFYVLLKCLITIVNYYVHELERSAPTSAPTPTFSYSIYSYSYFLLLHLLLLLPYPTPPAPTPTFSYSTCFYSYFLLLLLSPTPVVLYFSVHHLDRPDSWHRSHDLPGGLGLED